MSLNSDKFVMKSQKGSANVSEGFQEGAVSLQASVEEF